MNQLNIVTLGRDHRSPFAQELKRCLAARRGSLLAANTIDQVKGLVAHSIPITAVVRSRVDPADDELVNYCESRSYPVIQAGSMRAADVLPYLQKLAEARAPAATPLATDGAATSADPNAGSITDGEREREPETEKAPATEAAEA